MYKCRIPSCNNETSSMIYRFETKTGTTYKNAHICQNCYVSLRSE